jgi:hypothetical protein
MYSVANKETPGIPIPANVAAVWGGFIYEGLLADVSQEHMQRVLASWGQGCVGLVTAACAFLPDLWQQITVVWDDQDTDFPGVFEYEVVAELGKYLGDYLLAHDGNLPDVLTVRAQIGQLIREFFQGSAATRSLPSQALPLKVQA